MARNVVWGEMETVDLNGLCDPIFGLVPWGLHATMRGRRPRLVCVPSGQLMEEALRQHPWRKRLVAMDAREFAGWCAGALAYAQRYERNSQSVEVHRRLLLS